MINDYCTSLNTTVAPSSLDYCNSVSYSISVEFSRTTQHLIYERSIWRQHFYNKQCKRTEGG